MQGVKVQRRTGAEGQVLWVLENTEGEVRRRLGMGETGVTVEMDLDMVHREYSDSLRFRWQREAPIGNQLQERGMVKWESNRRGCHWTSRDVIINRAGINISQA